MKAISFTSGGGSDVLEYADHASLTISHYQVLVDVVAAGINPIDTKVRAAPDRFPVSLPCILLLKESNTCVLTRFPDSRTAEIMVAEGGGTRILPIAELEAEYTGHAIFLRPEFKFDARAADIRLSNPRRWFWGTLAQFWPIYSHVLLASIMINALHFL